MGIHQLPPTQVSLRFPTSVFFGLELTGHRILERAFSGTLALAGQDCLTSIFTALKARLLWISSS